MSKKAKAPYSKRTDIQKIKSNWTKAINLYDRREWSSCIVRAATAAEIAANLVVRQELVAKRDLDGEFVDHLLRWANGLHGKMVKLILPLTKGSKNHNNFKKLVSRIEDINRERNSIVHSGQFMKKTTAKKALGEMREIVLILVRPYHKEFTLKDLEKAV